MSQPRRTKVSIYDYPEHLNPFNDELNNVEPHTYQDAKTKDSKHKFWTFGRSRKKRSNSFSIKSTWSGLFGKRKDEKEEAQQKRSTITTVSSTYKRESYTKPTAPQGPTKDQEEFNEALGTLARRRKYTLDNSSRYSSSLTVNGDPARMYDGSPQDTTTSIMGELTPKPPARRFGQVSPKPTDTIPALDYESKTSPKENGNVTLREKPEERTPVPPLRRFGNRASQRANASTLDSEDEAGRPVDTAFCDENENVPEDYVFKRFTQDAVRKSNLSINSCTSVGSTMSAYGRKKRRAPQPPRPIAKVETSEITEAPSVELQIVEPSDIARVTENIDEMTKKSKDLVEDIDADEKQDKSVESVTDASSSTEATTTKDSPVESTEVNAEEKSPSEGTECTEEKSETELRSSPAKDEEVTEKVEEDVRVEYRRNSRENVEIMKEVEELPPTEPEEVCLRRKSSSDSLSRSDSFSVKEEIEKIEKQIKALEARNSVKESEDDQLGNTRLSLQANRRHFFQNLVDTEEDAIKIEFKEFPREQKDIHVVRLNDSPVPVPAPREPVKVIELHISEPIKQKAEIVEDVNPIPKPRRHSALSLNDTRSRSVVSTEERISRNDTRGKSF
ncbi:uncharacterized protein LOC143354599 isoform X2 [Halictus rubicundus]|uniref:uncharacterized protein LOC143354599 isoform X2 n=1 Tax=Halictus rubicundus TaxID=77578 RepID=UPI0040374E27